GVCNKSTCASSASTCTAMDGHPGMTCGGNCVDTAIDPANCGSCSHWCGPGGVCMGSMCYPPPPPPPTCPMPFTQCGPMCVDTQKRSAASTRTEVDSLRQLRRFFNVFVDVGAFAVAGNGSGIRSDIDHIYFPQYTGRIAGQWVFMGDPLSTAINSLGEPADTS